MTLMSAGVSSSPQKVLGGATRGAPGLLLRLEATWTRYGDSRPIAYVLFAILYVFPNLVLARHKLLWDDELFTLYLSKTRGWTELWRALSTGADQHPPSFYYLTHLIFRLAGSTHVTLRLAPLVCFALFCVCLCEIARLLVGPRWTLVALLLPLTTPALYYATEARGYGMEVGFVTFSLWMWILAAEGRKRAWTVPALAVGLCLSIASHYYAVFFLIPLAAGELAKTRLRRSIDVPVCCALLAALIPLVLFAPIILKAKTYSEHFWAVPFWSQMLRWYPNMTGNLLLLLLAATALTFVLRIPASQDLQDANSPLGTPVALPVAVVLTTSVLLPILGEIVAQFITHAFTDRYFIAALPGTCIIALWVLQRLSRNTAAGAALISILCILLAAQEWRQLYKKQASNLRLLRSAATLLRRTGNAPIVISDISTFHQLSFYGQRDLANRLAYVADPHRSDYYLGHDTVDRGLLALNPWFPLNVVWWHEWWRTHPFSLVYGGVSDWAWHTFALDEVGNVQLLNRDLSHLLLGVTRTNIPEDDRTPSDPPGKPMLYDQLAAGPPLCNVYMPSDHCPVVDDPNFPPVITYPELK